MKFVLAVLCITSAVNAAPHPDLYPQVHAILREAEAASLHISAFDDRSVPAEWAGHLYARAGYFEDAERTFGRTSTFPFALLKAYVFYGDAASAANMIARIANHYKQGQAELIVADLLWRMGQSANAEQHIEQAKKIASSLGDPAQRTKLLQFAEEDAQYMSSPPPNTLSPQPAPGAAKDADQYPFPQFPITADGFVDQTPAQREERASVDGALIQELYKRLRAGDRNGLEQMKNKVTAPFQRTLVIAGIEHLCIQAHQSEEAEQLAKMIPEADDECILAKAEALSSAAAEWLRSGRSDRANAGFIEAIKLAQSASKLPIGEVSVLTSIAEAEAGGGLAATSQSTLNIAEVVATQLPLPTAGLHAAPLSRSVHYRPEAYRRIFLVAVKAHDLTTARRIASLWIAVGGNSSGEVMSAWLQAGKPDEAIAVARGIQGTPQRAKMELWLAQQMLDVAGAPNI